MTTVKILVASMLSAMLAFGAAAAVMAIPAFAQIYGDDGAQMSGNTTAASSNATKLSGVIASLQNNEAGAPAWITAGHWTLESDRRIFDNAAEPQVSNFSAVVYMTSLSNGTNTHQHEITDFRQTSVLHSSQNVTTINGTVTVSMDDGPHENVPTFMHLQNDMISIWLDSVELEDHFGPTPVYGLMVPDHKRDSGGFDDDARGDDDTDNGQASRTGTQGTAGDDGDGG